MVRQWFASGIYFCGNDRSVRDHNWVGVGFSELAVVEEGGCETVWGKKEWGELGSWNEHMARWYLIAVNAVRLLPYQLFGGLWHQPGRSTSTNIHTQYR